MPKPTIAEVRAAIVHTRKPVHRHLRVHRESVLRSQFLDRLKLPSQFERGCALARIHGIDRGLRRPATFIGGAAAVLHGFDLPGVLTTFALAVERGSAPGGATSLPVLQRLDGEELPAEVRRVGFRIPPEHIVEVEGFRVASLEVTAISAAMYDPPDHALTIVGQAIRRLAGYPMTAPSDDQRAEGRRVKEGLLTMLRANPAWRRGQKRAARIIELADGANTNIAEFRGHHLLMALGFPEVIPQAVVVLANGRNVPDFHIPLIDAYVEIDGREKMQMSVDSANTPDEIRHLMAADKADELGALVQWSTEAGDVRIARPGDSQRIEDAGVFRPEWQKVKRIHAAYEARRDRDTAFRLAGHGIVHIGWPQLDDLDAVAKALEAEIRRPLDFLVRRAFLLP